MRCGSRGPTSSCWRAWPRSRRAVRAAADGDALIAPRITARLLAGFVDAARPAARQEPVVALTEREEEVAVTVARGLTNAEIAAAYETRRVVP